MSQAGVISASSSPAIPLEFDTDVNSPAVPAANILNVLGGYVATDNVNGIQTDGSSGGDTLTVQLTNRLTGTGTTVGAVTADIITLPLGATPAGFIIKAYIIGFAPATNLATAYEEMGCARTAGGVATVVDPPADETIKEDAALVTSDVDFVASANNVVVRVTGVAGQTINWFGVLTYNMVV